MNLYQYPLNWGKDIQWNKNRFPFLRKYKHNFNLQINTHIFLYPRCNTCTTLYLTGINYVNKIDLNRIQKIASFNGFNCVIGILCLTPILFKQKRKILLQKNWIEIELGYSNRNPENKQSIFILSIPNPEHKGY